MSELLSLASRKRIYDHVEAHSGCHLREIGRKCDVPLGTALYHLDRLETEGLLTVRRDGRYKRYFPATGLGRREKDLLSAFRHSVPRRVAWALLTTPALTQRELCAAIGVSRSTLSFHVNSMIEQQILRREPARPENRYLLEDLDLTRAILTKYRASLGDVGPLKRAEPVSSTAVSGASEDQDARLRTRVVTAASAASEDQDARLRTRVVTAASAATEDQDARLRTRVVTAASAATEDQDARPQARVVTAEA